MMDCSTGVPSFFSTCGLRLVLGFGCTLAVFVPFKVLVVLLAVLDGCSYSY